MVWDQKIIRIGRKSRGCHLITDEIFSALPSIGQVATGFLQVFLQHTSASLALNENADPDVLKDMEMAASRIAPEDFPWTHTCEGPDDMPAHVKTALFGPSLLIPLGGGRPLLGTWQGIYLMEHRDHAGSRQIVLTVQGEPLP